MSIDGHIMSVLRAEITAFFAVFAFFGLQTTRSIVSVPRKNNSRYTDQTILNVQRGIRKHFLIRNNENTKHTKNKENTKCVKENFRKYWYSEKTTLNVQRDD